MDPSKVNIDKPGSYNQGAQRSDRKSTLRKPVKAEVSEEDVQKQIKETLARLTEKRSKKGWLINACLSIQYRTTDAG